MKEMIQKKWLQLLAQAMNNEAALCALYARYAELFPEQAETWLVLSRSEQKHTHLLRALLSGGGPDLEHIPFDKLQSGPLDFISSQITAMMEKAASGEVMPTRAVTNALLLESSLVENFLFDAAPAAGPFRRVAEQLCRESKYHHQLVKRLQSGEAYLTEMPQAPAELAPEAVNPAAAKPAAGLQANAVLEAVPDGQSVNYLAKQAIIGAMARHEEAVAQLYRIYAELFPKMAEFWLQLAGEEIGHAEVLRAIGARVRSGELEFAAERFDLETIRISTVFLDNQLVVARHDPLDETRALGIAKLIEEKTIETQAFSVFTDDFASAELRTAFAALREQEVRHCEAINHMLRHGPYSAEGRGFFKRLFGGK